MRLAGAISLLTLVWVIPTYGADTSRCRCLSDDASCWPSQDDFDTLAQQVSQPLIHPFPPAQPCYLNANSSECAAAVANWTDGNWRADQPGAMQSPNFESFIFSNGTIDACYLNTTLGVPCDQGSVSVIGVEAHTVSDIQAAVKFAADHNLRLAVKNTGHDYLGRSNARGSFVIWTHRMKNITVHDSFVPSGAPANETYELAVTVHPGVQWHEAYDAVNASGRSMVGGVTAGGSVGAGGGWPLGGGHSALSPVYGLGIDNILEFTVVTSNGTFLTANAYRNPDLFWALRGGGGGTFGVVTSVTYRTHPIVPVVGAFMQLLVNASQPNAAYREAIAELVRLTPNLTDAGWGGYTTLTPSGFSNVITASIAFLIPNVSWADANATILPYFEHVQALAANSSADAVPLTLASATTVQFRSFLDWYAHTIAKSGGVGDIVELGSWLLPRTAFESAPADIAEVVVENVAGYYLVAGGAVNRVDPDAAGINPAWRKATVHAVTGALWQEGATADEINAQRDVLKGRMEKLRALAPESGVYFNEASLFEPDFKQAFFGSHYDRLREIKRAYDPIDLFVVHEGVASDEWDAELNCRL